MAPRLRYTVEDVIDSAFRIVRKAGMDKLTARAIAEDLKSSTMPIYSCGKSMQEIEEAVLNRAWDLMFEYQRTRRSGDVYLDMGLGYVILAREEPYLFKALFSPKHKEFNRNREEKNFVRNMALLKDYPMFEGMDDAARLKIVTHAWIYIHGFADLLVNSGHPEFDHFDREEDLVKYFIEANLMVWVGMDRFVKDYKEMTSKPSLGKRSPEA